MKQTHKILYDEISRLPIDKIGKVLSYVKYINRECDNQLHLESYEEDELDDLYKFGDFIDESDVKTSISAMTDDKIS